MSVPINELLTLVPARANKKAGNRYPRKPEATKYLVFSLGYSFRRLMIKGKKTKPADIILNAPICTGVKVGRAFFMIKKEDPHIVANRQSSSQAIMVLFWVVVVVDVEFTYKVVIY